MVTSYYIMKMDKKIISMEEYYSGLLNTPAMFSTHLEQKSRCRVCLQEDDLISITEDINYSKFKEALNIFGNINIDDEKDLTYLCDICHKFLKSATLFRKIAILTNQKLQQSLDHLDDKQLNKFTYWVHLDQQNVATLDELSLKVKSEDEPIHSPMCEETDASSSSEIQLDEYHYEGDWLNKLVKVEDDGTRVQCPICEEFLSKSLYEVHLLKEHNLNEKSEGQKDENIEILKKHLLKPEPEIDDGTEIVSPVCGEYFSKSPHLNQVGGHYSNCLKEESVKIEFEVEPIAQKSDKPIHKTRRQNTVHLEDQNPQTSKEIEESRKVYIMPEHLTDHQYSVIRQEDTAEENAMKEHTNSAGETEPMNVETLDKDLVDNDTKVQCPMCQKFLNKSLYKAHLTKEHKTKPNNDKSLEQELKDKVQLQCLICGKHISLLLYPDHLHGHKLNPEEHPPVCPICSKVFKTIDIFKTHLEIHDPNAPVKYVCEICGKSFKRNMVYKNHVGLHETKYIYKCEMCPYAGRYKARLKHHMLIHTGELKYLCTQCPARYIYSSSLSRHIQRQHTDREHKCDSCDKAYFTNLDLKRHIDSAHLGIRNHECNVCGMTFGYRKALRKHQKGVHKTGNINPFLSRTTSLSIIKKLSENDVINK